MWNKSSDRGLEKVLNYAEEAAKGRRTGGNLDSGPGKAMKRLVETKSVFQKWQRRCWEL